ncbi:hypothetical protein HPP92_007385 [Vanilla planifolia]|uniref:MHD1 domain-containing protein n=1 Tax=Vanilla planifolia TaxID=51239 RepID=A0A835V5U5_VANPL|nr:hypothetical protein HPP92_007385 [Vanilla planifolia]
MEPSLLLQRYRSDRRKLLELIFSQGLVKVPSADPPDRSDMQLDNVSADYVLECVKSGGAFVREEAVERYNCGMDMPIMVSVPVGNSFFLLSNPDESGSPPHRVAPLVGEKATFDHFMYPSMQKDFSVGKGVKAPMSESEIGCSAPTSILSKPTDDMNKFCLGLPPFLTGLSEDDMRETAYEVFLASVVHSGGQKSYFEDNKKERKSKFLKGLRSRRDGSHSQSDESRSDLMDIIRGQMEISEAMDAWTKKGLRNFCLGSMPSRADVHRIAMELLRTLSVSDFPSRKIYRQWQNRQADVLQELLLDPANSVAAEQKMLLNLLSKLRNLEDWINLSNEVRTETLTWIEKLFSSMSSMPTKFVVSDVTYYCTRSFYFSVKLYLKLLSSIFDILEDGRIVEEADEILGALRMTWSMLGITQIMHDVLYGWALFQQFVHTGDLMLLKFTILEIRRIITYKDGDGDLGFENKTISSVETFDCRRDFSLIDTVLFKIYHWCSTKLEDYHLHFSMGESQIFEGILTLSLLSGLRFAYECCETKVPRQSLAYPEAKSESGVTSDFVHTLVEKSSQAAFKRALGTLDAKSNIEQKHPLVVLAKELKAFAEKEHAFFTPILCRLQPKAGIVFCVLFHQYYGEQLKPYLEGISGFTESAIPVLSASYCLERCLGHIIQSISEVRKSAPITNYVDPYQIREICSPFILDLVNLRHEKILGWTERAILIENWEPLSFQQKQAASVIEVFRMIHEAIDQFFDLIIPMDTIHLRSLLIGIVRSLEAYLQQIISQQVDKDCLYPSPATLTRYKESVNPFLKKKAF